MNKDKELLLAIKEEFWWFMIEPERSVWSNYWLLVSTKNYSLSKKNLDKLEKIINIIQIRRQQAKQAIFHNPLFE